jgi:hypothetical protein
MGTLKKTTAQQPNAEHQPAPPRPAVGRPKAERPKPKEVGGRDGPEPTRYCDWEVRGICVDF